MAFGYLAVRKFLDNNDLMCVIRAHAVQEDGYYRHFEKALKRRDVGEFLNEWYTCYLLIDRTTQLTTDRGRVCLGDDEVMCLPFERSSGCCYGIFCS